LKTTLGGGLSFMRISELFIVYFLAVYVEDRIYICSYIS